MAYTFFFGKLQFPVTPDKLTVKIKNQNKTTTLINDGEINILKLPGLTEIEFDACFPQVRYPFASYPQGFQPPEYYMQAFEALKKNREPFQFIVSRASPAGKRYFSTNLRVSLEDYSVKEDAKEGNDVTISFNLKQYRDYGTKPVKITPKKTVKKTAAPRAAPKKKGKTYKVKGGDMLWGIAKKYYGNGAQYTKIYNANKSVIEAAAKRHGKKSSSNGHWIWAGTVLTIP